MASRLRVIGSRAGPRTVRPGGGITMLGAQATGKTTFLGALQIALLRRAEPRLVTGRRQRRYRRRRWSNFVDAMTDEHIFPKPTTDIATTSGPLRRSFPSAVKEWHWWGYRRRDQDVRIPARPGGRARRERRQQADVRPGNFRALIENLGRSAGIVLFFDPMSEFERGDAFRTHVTEC